MTLLQETRHKAAADLALLIDDAHPDDTRVTDPVAAYDTITSIANHTLALALDQHAEILRDLIADRGPKPSNATIPVHHFRP